MSTRARPDKLEREQRRMLDNQFDREMVQGE